MTNIARIINHILEKKDISQEEVRFFLDEVIGGRVSPVQIAAFLTALRAKRESPDEIAAFISAMRDHMVRITSPDAVDACGTGGDGSGTFNISTAAAFVSAGAGARVVKHGNRAVSSKCGSADVLEQLGVHIQLSPRQAEEVFRNVGMVFLFAPLFHPAMKHIAAVRKDLGVRTIFNFLGPFLNPASPERQVVGVPNPELARTLADAAKTLRYKHLLIVSSEDGLDEASTSSNNIVFEIKNDSSRRIEIDPKTHGFAPASREEFQGGGAERNAEIIEDILSGTKDGKRDIVVFNSALVLYTAGSARDIHEGIRLAEASIDNGSAKSVLETLVRETRKYI